MPTNKNKQHCQSLTTAGAPCRAWAQPGSNPPRCNIHGPHALPTTPQRRCAATTAQGQPCPHWAMHHHHLCSVHARRTIPHADQHRRCHAHTKNGQPCRAWALRHSNPPCCQMHVGNTQPPNNPDHQHHRCQAHTRGGSGGRCRNWATRHSRRQVQHHDAPALCAAHAGQYTLRAPHKHRCNATTAAGQPCPHWALPRTEAPYRIPGKQSGVSCKQSDVRLCRMHLPASDPRRIAPRLPRSPHRRCAAKTHHSNGGRNRRRCRHWSLPHDQAHGRCWLHAHPHQHPRLRHGYYRRTPHFTPAARAYITKLIRDRHPLHAGLLIARLKLQDLAAYLTRRAATRLLYRAISAVARLLHAHPRAAPQTTLFPNSATRQPANAANARRHNKISHDPPSQTLPFCPSRPRNPIMTTRKPLTKRPCTATRADGQPCRAWARHDSHPPRCAAHTDPAPAAPQSPPDPSPGDPAGPGNPGVPGDGHLYDHNFSDQELARLQSLTHERSLSSEARLLRVMVDRLAQDLDPQHNLTRADILNTVAALYQGIHMVGKLWKLQVAIEKGGNDIHPAIASALDDIGEEWNIDL